MFTLKPLITCDGNTLSGMARMSQSFGKSLRSCSRRDGWMISMGGLTTLFLQMRTINTFMRQRLLAGLITW